MTLGKRRRNMARYTTRNTNYLNQKAAACGVEYDGGYGFTINSPSGNSYRVSLNGNLDGGRCTCPWAAEYSKHSEKAASLCAHILAAINWCAGEAGRTARAYASEEAAKRQKRSMAGSSQGVWFVTRKVVTA
jgi:hypothetical protein